MSLSRAKWDRIESEWKVPVRLPRKRPYNAAVLRVLQQQTLAPGNLEIFKIKAGRYGAAHQGKPIVYRTARGKPLARMHGGLVNLALRGIAAQLYKLQAALGINYKYLQHIAIVKMPKLIALYAVEGAEGVARH